MQVKEYGPLSGLSGFPFESANYKLLRTVSPLVSASKVPELVAKRQQRQFYRQSSKKIDVDVIRFDKLKLNDFKVVKDGVDLRWLTSESFTYSNAHFYCHSTRCSFTTNRSCYHFVRYNDDKGLERFGQLQSIEVCEKPSSYEAMLHILPVPVSSSLRDLCQRETSNDEMKHLFSMNSMSFHYLLEDDVSASVACVQLDEHVKPCLVYKLDDFLVCCLLLSSFEHD